ncbi:prolyl oligopeptidase family serine peptidase [Aeoliella sp. SH292]|uniref:prolyl oligopeptidase family serine peptidase n=1 Tax=Aeoliella sp. SH292 TaxID=3454464 RepID=UPI003F99BF3D
MAFSIPALEAESANTQQVFSYSSTITTDASGPLDLLAELNYDSARQDAPIVVVMHGYSPTNGNFGNVRANAERLRDAGFFAISVAMRGRDGSDGVRDSGGLEVYDIYDAVESVKAAYPQLVDESNIHITGYSGGGGNVMSALTKFPDYFRAGSSFFGMSDYGHDPTTSWYAEGAASNHQSQLRTDVGDPTLGDSLIADRYMARASYRAAANNPYSEVHLFVNANETVCPPVNITKYRDAAVAGASTPGEFDNVSVHIAPVTPQKYQDFNRNRQNEPSELQWWPHGFPTADQQAAGEGWYLQRVLSGEIPQPVLNSSDQLVVAGFVKTTHFELFIGDGQNGAGVLDYSLSPEAKSFHLEIETSNLAIGTKLKIDTSDMAAKQVKVIVNGDLLETITGGGVYQTEQLGHEGTLLLQVAVDGDYDHSGVVDAADYLVWKQTIGSSALLSADGNRNGVVDLSDFTIWRDNLGATPSSPPNVASSTQVPEPNAQWLMAAGSLFYAVSSLFIDSRTSLELRAEKASHVRPTRCLRGSSQGDPR